MRLRTPERNPTDSEGEGTGDVKYAKIAVSDVTFWVDRPYDYAVPASLSEKTLPGMRVTVPFSRGNRKAEGIVLSVSDHCDYDSPKALIALLDDAPVLTEQQIRLALWMRERFFCTVYEAVRAILPAGLWFTESGRRKATDKRCEFVRLAVSGEEALALAEQKASRAKMQASVLRLLSGVGEASVADVRSLTGASRASIAALTEDEILEFTYKEVFRRPEYRRAETRSPLPDLTAEQKLAYDGIVNQMKKETPGAALLYGVTGSGKTSVYVHLISDVLRSGGSAIMLVPEIALTPQMLETFSSYFGDQIAVLHSSLSVAERYDEWKRVRSGSARLVIGTRSAIFAPAVNLGLIIIDEEQEDSYKSENAPRYHAKDIAKYRCSSEKSLLLLGSATPDVATRYQAETGRYGFYTLRTRYNRMELPDVRIVDMKRELRSGNGSSISGFLRSELEKNLDSGEQSILFLNRRGTAKLVSCVDCGFHFQCPNCSVSLTYHSAKRRVQCHVCGYSAPLPNQCPDCGGELKFSGDGTEKVESQLQELFPGTATLRVDIDTVTDAGGHEPLFTRFREERIPIMIGTQMVTKGLNFENVTLVGVLFADQSLYAGDYRASERSFSLMTQVIGRSGRAERSGRAVIQTFTPENQIIRFAARQDYEGFYAREIELRQLQRCPPFVQLVSLSVIGADELRILQSCERIRDLLQHALNGEEGIDVLGPAPYPVVKAAGRFRYRLTIRSSSDAPLRSVVTKILNYCNREREFRGISVYADRNPLE